MADKKSEKIKFTAPSGFTEASTEFKDSADGWYQYDLTEKPEDLPPWEGEYLGPDEITIKDEPRRIHKFRLSQPCQALGAKGTDGEGKIVTLKPGQILSVFGKWELDTKLSGKEGARVWVKPLGPEEIVTKSGDRTLWRYSVFFDEKTVKARPTNASPAQEPIPF